jgi:arylsulfatase A-like enzyme
MKGGIQRVGVRAAAVCCAVALSPLNGAAGQPARPDSAGSVAGEPSAEPAARRPSIVLIVLDDASLNVVALMRNVRAMSRRSAVYRNAFVADSFCCPSRAAMFTGLPPHLNGVLTNNSGGPGPDRGGWAAFKKHGNLARSYNVPLRQAGYRTGFVGKYLNEHNLRVRDGRRLPPPPVPGWDDFEALLPAAYSGWGFFRTLGPGDRLRMRLVPKPKRSAPRHVKDRSYAQTVITRRALHLIDEYRRAAEPYFLQVSTYAPHASLVRAWPDEPIYPAAFADRPSKARPGGNCGLRACSSLNLRDLVGYRDPPADNRPVILLPGGGTRVARSWRPRLTMPDAVALTRFRERAQMVQSVDRMVGRIRAAVGRNTYVVLTSDNGYHLGQHSLNAGKGAPYDSDTRVPLMVSGPGVKPGPRYQFISNIDLASTLENLAGLEPSGFRVGRSFAPSLSRPRAGGSRFVFIQHTQSLAHRNDPDAQPWEVDKFPSYQAVRSRRGLLVRVDLNPSWRGKRYVWELYRYDRPWEDRNVFRSDRRKPWARALMRHLRAWDGCAADKCRDATTRPPIDPPHR